MRTENRLPTVASGIEQQRAVSSTLSFYCAQYEYCPECIGQFVEPGANQPPRLGAHDGGIVLAPCYLIRIGLARPFGMLSVADCLGDLDHSPAPAQTFCSLIF